MSDRIIRPDYLPTKLGPKGSGNEGNLLALLGLLDIEMSNQFFTSDFDSSEYEKIINSTFNEFQTWCWEIYYSLSNDKNKVYHFFTDAQNRYQLFKEKNYVEKESKIQYSAFKDPSQRVQTMININYEYLNRAIGVLNDYLSKEEPPITVIQTKPKIQGFRAKNKEILSTVYDKLRLHLVIDKSVTYQDFEMAFSGWMPKNKIVWLLGPGLLSYFIKKINGKGIENEKKDIWITTINCFQDRNFNEYSIEQLRFAKKPTKTVDVDFAIKVINKGFEIKD